MANHDVNALGDLELDELLQEAQHEHNLRALVHIVSVCEAAWTARLASGAVGGTSSAQRHLVEHGHLLAHGCCARAANARAR